MTNREPLTLLGPDDPAPFRTVNADGSTALLLVADHACRNIPLALDQLGVADWVMQKHVAWDMGSAIITQELARLLDAPAVLAGYSRLVIDPNRRLDDPGSIPEISDGIAIPGNIGLSPGQRDLRAQSCFWPYHNEVADQLRSLARRGPAPAMLAIHSCTPVFNEMIRPWHIGVLWNEDERISGPLIRRFRAVDGLNVGDNEPYSGKHTHSFTLNHHAEPPGLPHAGIEVRQDLVVSPAGARCWAEILAEQLRPVLADLGLCTDLRAAG